MPSPAAPDYAEAMATVLSCTYAPRTGRALAFGLPSGKHFRIRYNYWAHGALHEDELFSSKPIPQGNVFPVHYDPGNPGRVWQGDSTPPAPAGRVPLLAIGLLGSVVLSLAWLLILRGCS